MSKRIKSVYEFTKKRLEKANQFFEEGDVEDCIQNIWSVFENCINLLKDSTDHAPLYQHKPKTDLFRKYFRENVLSRDYSSFHKEIDEYRIRAFLSDYSRTKVLPPKSCIGPYLEKAKKLFEEIEQELKKKGLLEEHEPKGTG